MSETALEFISALVRSDNPNDFVEFSNASAMFEFDKSGAKHFAKFEEFVDKYGTLPSVDAFEKETGIELPKVEDPVAYYYDRVKKKHITRAMVAVGDQIREHLQDKDPELALETMTNIASLLQFQMTGQKIYDFREAYNFLLPQLEAQWSDSSLKVPFGWPHMDDPAKGSGGVGSGDLVSLIGRPAQGKTWFLLYIALSIWQQTNRPVLFVSMEMTATAIFARLAAMQTHTKMSLISSGAFPNLFGDSKKKFIDSLKELNSPDREPFYVVDGNLTSTVADIIPIAMHTNAAAVLIDGAYLVQHPDIRNIYEAVNANTGLMKSKIATALQIPVFASWQFSREATKLKKGERPSLQHIGYSDAIGQLSSVVLGLFEEDSPETLIRRKVDVLKGREGEVGEFFVNWDFDDMDFSQAEEKYKESLPFI